MLVSLAVLIGSMQPNMARRAQGHPGSNPGVFPFGPFWSTWRTLRRSILGPKRPRRSFPSAVKYLDSESMTPSTVIRPRFVSVQVPEVADFAFCPIVGRATAVSPLSPHKQSNVSSSGQQGKPSELVVFLR